MKALPQIFTGFVFCVGLLLSLPVNATAYYGDLVVEKYLSAYDGDTFRMNISDVHPIIGRDMPIRLRGVDTPEIRGRCDEEKALAIKARDFVRDLRAIFWRMMLSAFASRSRTKSLALIAKAFSSSHLPRISGVSTPRNRIGISRPMIG